MFVPSSVSLSVELSASISGSTISLKFPTLSGHSYTVLFNTNLNGGSWQTLPGGPVAGDGTTKTVTDTVSGAERFYILKIQ